VFSTPKLGVDRHTDNGYLCAHVPVRVCVCVYVCVYAHKHTHTHTHTHKKSESNHQIVASCSPADPSLSPSLGPPSLPGVLHCFFDVCVALFLITHPNTTPSIHSRHHEPVASNTSRTQRNILQVTIDFAKLRSGINN